MSETDFKSINSINEIKWNLLEGMTSQPPFQFQIVIVIDAWYRSGTFDVTNPDNRIDCFGYIHVRIVYTCVYVCVYVCMYVCIIAGDMAALQWLEDQTYPNDSWVGVGWSSCWWLTIFFFYYYTPLNSWYRFLITIAVCI